MIKSSVIAIIILFVSITSLSALNIGVIGTHSATNVINVMTGAGHSAIQVTDTSTQLSNLDAVFLMRVDGDNNVESFVLNGGLLVTEWEGADWAINTAGLLNASISGGGNVGTGQTVTFTTEGSFLAQGIPGGAYAAGGATQFFRDFSSVGVGVDILATRNGGATAIVGGQSGQGYTLAIAYDWGDGGGAGSDPETNQMLLNALNSPVTNSDPVPEPSSLLLLSLASIFVLRYTTKKDRKQID